VADPQRKCVEGEGSGCFTPVVLRCDRDSASRRATRRPAGEGLAELDQRRDLRASGVHDAPECGRRRRRRTALRGCRPERAAGRSGQLLRRRGLHRRHPDDVGRSQRSARCRHGLALAYLGDIDAQSVAGDIATGSHGTGRMLGNLATLVRSLRVWFRHAEAGELCERVDILHLAENESIVATVPSYRGERKAFL
jgi:hypothetical protein